MKTKMRLQKKIKFVDSAPNIDNFLRNEGSYQYFPQMDDYYEKKSKRRLK